jgi:hypothetical protein
MGNCAQALTRPAQGQRPRWGQFCEGSARVGGSFGGQGRPLVQPAITGPRQPCAERAFPVSMSRLQALLRGKPRRTCMTGPMAIAPVACCTALYVLLPAGRAAGGEQHGSGLGAGARGPAAVLSGRRRRRQPAASGPPSRKTGRRGTDPGRSAPRGPPLREPARPVNGAAPSQGPQSSAPARSGPPRPAAAPPVLRSGNTNTLARPATSECVFTLTLATAGSMAASYWIGPSTWEGPGAGWRWGGGCKAGPASKVWAAAPDRPRAGGPLRPAKPRRGAPAPRGPPSPGPPAERRGPLTIRPGRISLTIFTASVT